MDTTSHLSCIPRCFPRFQEEERWITLMQRCLAHPAGMGTNPSHGTSTTRVSPATPAPSHLLTKAGKSHRNPTEIQATREGRAVTCVWKMNQEKAFWKFQEHRDEGSNPLWRLGKDPTCQWNLGIPAPHPDTPESNTKASQVERSSFFPPEFASPLEVA